MTEPKLESIHWTMRWMDPRPGDQNVSLKTGKLVSIVINKGGENLECRSVDYSNFCKNECNFTGCPIKRNLERG